MTYWAMVRASTVRRLTAAPCVKRVSRSMNEETNIIVEPRGFSTTLRRLQRHVAPGGTGCAAVQKTVTRGIGSEDTVKQDAPTQGG